MHIGTDLAAWTIGEFRFNAGGDQKGSSISSGG
jgi:hypothetical protein